MKRRLRAEMGLVATVGTFALAAPAFGGTLDQENSSGATGGGIIGTHCDPSGCIHVSGAQTFTAGITGELDQVDVHLARSSESTTAPLTIEIRGVSEGCPSSDVLATETIPASEVPIGSSDWVVVTFSDPASVVAGSQYAIVVYAEPGDSAQGYKWFTSPSDTYAAGQRCSSFASPPSSWRAESESDRYFKTYVAQPAGSQPSNDEPRPTCKGEEATIAGTPDDDSLTGTNGDDSIVGFDGDDEIGATGGEDCLAGNAGKDVLRGGAGHDLALGGPGKDKLRGQNGADKLRGKNGNDKVNGGNGQDSLKGGLGNDKLRGAGAKDTIKGNGGNDQVGAQDGKRDRINCGGGEDRAVVDPVDEVSNCETVNVVDPD